MQKEPRRMHTAGLQLGGWPLQKKINYLEMVNL